MTWRDKPRVRYIPSLGVWDITYGGWAFCTVRTATPLPILGQIMERAQQQALKHRQSLPAWVRVRVG